MEIIIFFAYNVIINNNITFIAYTKALIIEKDYFKAGQLINKVGSERA